MVKVQQQNNQNLLSTSLFYCHSALQQAANHTAMSTNDTNTPSHLTTADQQTLCKISSFKLVRRIFRTHTYHIIYHNHHNFAQWRLTMLK